MRRPCLLALVLLTAVPAAASAQLPQPAAPQPPAPEQEPQLQPANVRVSVASGARYEKRRFSVAGERVRVKGRMNRAAAGERVTVELLREGERRGSFSARVGSDGRFGAFFEPAQAGGWAVRATHAKSDTVERGSSARAAFTVVAGEARRGASGARVAILQRKLAAMGYAIPKSGRYDDATARAVLAYRKVNRMARITSVNREIMSRVFRGEGGYELKYPGAGKHVEADLSRQVLVLARNGKPWRVYHTSTGTSATPTVRGSYRFYRKDPGSNSLGMYYSSYFIRGYAIHGFKSVPTSPASHGCLRVPMANAVSIYNWIDLGDRIFVYA